MIKRKQPPDITITVNLGDMNRILDFAKHFLEVRGALVDPLHAHMDKAYIDRVRSKVEAESDKLGEWWKEVE